MSLPLSTNYKQVVLLMTSIAVFMVPFDITLVNVSLPVIASSLKLDYATLIWIPTACLVPLTVLPLTIGRISDMRGRKPVFIFGLAEFILFSFLSSTSSSGSELVIFRGLQGIGAASTQAVAAAIVTDVFPSAERGKALGTTTMAAYTGLTLGPSLGGLITYAIGWRSIFYINIPIGICLIVLAALKLRESAPAASRQLASSGTPSGFDIAGGLLFSFSVIPFLVALTLAEVYSWTSPVTVALFVVAIVSISSFLFVETRRTMRRNQHKSGAGLGAAESHRQQDGFPTPDARIQGKRPPVEPMLDTSLFTRNRLFAAANLSALLNYAAYYGVTLLVPFYLQRVVGYTPLQAGIILLAMPITMAALSPFSGRLSDRIGSRVPSSLGMALICTALLLMSTLPQVSIASSPPGMVSVATEEIILYLFILGFGLGIFSAPNISAVMGSVGKSKLGVASGMLATMRYLGQALGIAVTGAILASVASNAIVSAFFVGASTSSTSATISLFLAGMREALTASAVIGAAGVLTSLVRGGSRTVTEQDSLEGLS